MPACRFSPASSPARWPADLTLDPHVSHGWASPQQPYWRASPQQSYWREEALSRIPPGIQAASKQGAVSASKSEVVLVNAPHGDYVFCIITDDQEDTRWEYDNAGYVLIRDVSRILWEAFEPERPYTPQPLMSGSS